MKSTQREGTAVTLKDEYGSDPRTKVGDQGSSSQGAGRASGFFRMAGKDGAALC